MLLYNTCWNPDKSQYYGGSHDWEPLELLTLRVFHIEPPVIHQLQVSFLVCPIPALVSTHKSLISHVVMYSLICLSSLSGSCLPFLSSLTDPRRIADFSVWSIFHVIWVEWWPLSSLHVEPEFTQNIHFFKWEKAFFSFLILIVLHSKLLRAEFMTFSFTI